MGYTTQVAMIKAEYERNIAMATNQFQQQRDQSILALEQQQKQQEMQLNMAKQQRLMAISQQAASMQAQAQQHKLQMEMQQKMSTLYSGAGAAGRGEGREGPEARHGQEAEGVSGGTARASAVRSREYPCFSYLRLFWRRISVRAKEAW